MSQLKVEQYVVGPVMTNCYFGIYKNTKETIIVDPGDQGDQLIAKIREEGLIPKAILLTHGHFDHATAAEEVAKEFGISIYANEAEQETLENASWNLSGAMAGVSQSFHADVYLKDMETIELAGFQIQMFHTPGHTVGGACYYLKEEKALFSGDTLFAQSVGRTDFPKGSASELIRSIQEKLMVLPDDVTVYTGHNEITTIGTERKYNPFL